MIQTLILIPAELNSKGEIKMFISVKLLAKYVIIIIYALGSAHEKFIV